MPNIQNRINTMQKEFASREEGKSPTVRDDDSVEMDNIEEDSFDAEMANRSSNPTQFQYVLGKNLRKFLKEKAESKRREME